MFDKWISKKQQKTQSIMDTSLEITEDKWAITLTRNGQHALLLVESLYKGSYELRRYDLIPKEKVCYWVCGFFHQGSGQVRSTEIAGVKSKAELYQTEIGKNLQKDISNTTWLISSEDVRTMQKAINKEAARNNTDKAVKFNSKGNYYGNGHSCITWAQEKLQLAGIGLNESSCFTATSDCLTRREVTQNHVADQQGKGYCNLS